MKAISYVLISEYRLIYSSMKSQSNQVNEKQTSYDWKDKVNPTVNGKILQIQITSSRK